MSLGFLVLLCWQKELLPLHPLANQGQAVHMNTAPPLGASISSSQRGSIAASCWSPPRHRHCGGRWEKQAHSGLLYILFSFDFFLTATQTLNVTTSCSQVVPRTPMLVLAAYRALRGDIILTQAHCAGRGGQILGIISMLRYIPDICFLLTSAFSPP